MRECGTCYMRRWRRENPDKTRIQDLKNLDRMRRETYGIGNDGVEELLDRQGGTCAICGTDDSGSREWHVDHDHVSLKIRGILCSRCNTAIGLMNDDPQRLKGAADYIWRHRN